MMVIERIKAAVAAFRDPGLVADGKFSVKTAGDLYRGGRMALVVGRLYDGAKYPLLEYHMLDGKTQYAIESMTWIRPR